MWFQGCHKRHSTGTSNISPGTTHVSVTAWDLTRHSPGTIHITVWQPWDHKRHSTGTSNIWHTVMCVVPGLWHVRSQCCHTVTCVVPGLWSVSSQACGVLWTFKQQLRKLQHVTPTHSLFTVHHW